MFGDCLLFDFSTRVAQNCCFLFAYYSYLFLIGAFFLLVMPNPCKYIVKTNILYVIALTGRENQITPPAQGGAGGSVRLLPNKKPRPFLQLPQLPGTRLSVRTVPVILIGSWPD